MNPDEIPARRLANQRITGQKSMDPAGVVSHLGAVQAQDYKAALWGIGLRSRGARREDVERAIADRKIVRTWAMRHTLHFAPPEDIRWMLDLYPDESIPKYQRNNGLTEEILARGLAAIRKAFGKEEQITYRGMHELLRGSGIPRMEKSEVRSHVIRRAGREGIICFGAHDGKNPTFALLDEWVPKARKLDRREALAKFAMKYFSSHGPATARDFAWWSGLKASDVREGIEGAAKMLREEAVSGITYYMPRRGAPPSSAGSAHLLPGFDEYLISYSDRSASLKNHDTQMKLKGGVRIGHTLYAYPNGIFLPIIVVDGQVVGLWKQENGRDRIVVNLKPFAKLSRSALEMLSDDADRYGRFMGMPAEIGQMR